MMLPCTVGKNLKFDMAGTGDRPFEDHLVGTEGARRFRTRHERARRRNPSIAVTSRMPRPPPPAAALIMTGKPIRQASSASLSSD